MISNIVSHGGGALKRVRFSRLSGLSIESDSIDSDPIDSIDFHSLLRLECWIQLHVRKPEGSSRKTVTMPWRGDVLWLGGTPSIKTRHDAWLTIEDEIILRS